MRFSTAVSSLILLSTSTKNVSSFSVMSPNYNPSLKSKTSLSASSTNNINNIDKTRASFLSSISTGAASILISASKPAFASDEESSSSDSEPIPTPGKSYTIESCNPDTSSVNCISTSSVKGAQTVSPPWDFTCDPEKAWTTLLDVLKNEEKTSTNFSVDFVDTDAKYVQATIKKNLVNTYTLEFYIRPDDKVVLYRSEDTDFVSTTTNNKNKGSSDFGASKKRLEKIRKESNGVFQISEEEYFLQNYAAQSGGGNGPLGQLKAFYGLNSGQGFEDVFD